MSLVGRIARVVGVVGNAVVLVTIAGVALRYTRRQGIEVELVMPLLPPVVAIVAILVAARQAACSGRIRRGALVGLAAGATLYVAVSAAYLFGSYEVISRDGTAYWSLVLIPAVWVWPPVLVGSTLLGALAQFVATRSRRQGDDA